MGQLVTTLQSGDRLPSFFEGLLLGSLSDNDSWAATAGSIVGGLIPGVGLLADIRDLGAALSHVANGDDGAVELGASVIGFVPGGDIAKGLAKGARTAAKTTAKVGADVVDDVAKVVKGSTATAADGLSGAQKGAGKVNAPRGPPASTPATNAPKKRGGESPKAAYGRQKHEELKKKVEKKEGWDPRPTLKDPKTGKLLHPDALTRNRNPIELKPNTPSGRAAGKRQMKKYEAASNGRKGRIIYYDS